MSLRRPLAPAFLAASIAAAASAGCGGGPEQLSAEELVERGDPICREVQARFDEVQAAPLTSATAGEKQAEELIDVAEGAQQDLRDLEPPEEIRDTYQSYLDSREEVSDQLEEGREAAARNDGSAYGRAQEKAAAGAPERQRLARQLGFTVCSQGTRAP